MPLIKHTVKNFTRGLITSIEAKSIPEGAASSSLNWLTLGDKIELRRGYQRIGTDAGVGGVTGLQVSKKADGSTEVAFRTRGKKIEYYTVADGDWTEIGSDQLGTAADGEDVTFAVYVSPSGNQTWVSSPNSSYYKIMTANPADIVDQFNSAKNFKGRITTILNRMFLWFRLTDKSGIYGSFIDKQNYTTVSSEVLGTGDGAEKTFAGTLAFKAGGAKRTCFGIEVTDTVETFTDDYSGVLTGDAGGTGTINYATGAISVTFNAAPAGAQNITVDYQWEDSTNEGIADFTESGTRLAGEGFIFRQDDEGGEIKKVSTYNDIQYCLHEKKTWRLNIGADDTLATNRIFRENVGIPNHRAAVETGEGIYYIDDRDQSDIRFRLLTIGGGTDQIIPRTISANIKLEDFVFDKAETFERGDYIMFACRTSNSTINNRVLLYNRLYKSFDIIDYYVSKFGIFGGVLWAGDSSLNNVYELFSGFDDDGALIGNHWNGNLSEISVEGLKKTKKFVTEGDIAPDQTIEVYMSFDHGAFVLIGEISGDGSYVDIGQSISVGSVVVGSKEVGGGGGAVTAYHYKRTLKVNQGKFNEVKVRYVATDIGYASVSMYQYRDIRKKSDKLVSKYRSTS